VVFFASLFIVQKSSKTERDFYVVFELTGKQNNRQTLSINKNCSRGETTTETEVHMDKNWAVEGDCGRMKCVKRYRQVDS